MNNEPLHFEPETSSLTFEGLISSVLQIKRKKFMICSFGKER